MNTAELAQSELRSPLGIAAAVSAWLAGAILIGLGSLSVYSIVSRSLGFDPVMGDFEMVQAGLAVCIALFLPWCHLCGGNIIVDFFTVRAAQRSKRRLDAFGNILFALVMALVAWRTGAGAAAMLETGETTMLLGFPLWISYAAMTPGFALAALVAVAMGCRAWREGAHG